MQSGHFDNQPPPRLCGLTSNKTDAIVFPTRVTKGCGRRLAGINRPQARKKPASIIAVSMKPIDLTKPSPPPTGEPIPLIPPPPILSALTDTTISRAFAQQRGRTVLIRAESDSRTWMWECVAAAPAFRCFLLDTPSTRRRRIPVTLTPHHHAALVTFTLRFLWAMGAGEDSGYKPTPQEIHLRELVRRLITIARGETDSAPADFPPHHENDPWGAAVLRWIDLTSGRWDDVLPLLDRPLSTHTPSWFRMLVTLIGGDVSALREVAADPCPERGEAALLEGAFLYAGGFAEAALLYYETASRNSIGKRQANICLEIARLAVHLGNLEKANVYLHRAITLCPNDDELLMRVCEEWIRFGNLDAAYQTLVAGNVRLPWSRQVALLYTELLLWAQRTDEVPSLLEKLRTEPADARFHRVHGIWLALTGAYTEARTAFATAVEMAPFDMESLAWLGEIQLRLGQLQDAERSIATSRALAQTPVHTLLTSALRDPNTFPKRWELIHLLNALGQPLDPWLRDPVSAVLAVLSRFGGNRGPWLTQKCVPTSTHKLGIIKVDVPTTDRLQLSRNESAQTLRLITTLPIEEVANRFDDLANEYPESPHPFCYRGELALWMGDYEGAIVQFELALKRTEARWGYVGKAAAYILLGRFERAQTSLEQCSRVFTPVVGATTPVYVGEMLRILGNDPGAICELTEAVRTKPGRIGAWMNLALCHIRMGDIDRAQSILVHLQHHAPVLLYNAQRSAGELPCWPIEKKSASNVLEEALKMMRGNRSSHTITYFDRSGTLKISRDGEQIQRLAKTQAVFLASAIRGRLIGGD